MDRGGHAGGVLSLDQIRSIRSRNEYTEAPATPLLSAPAPPPRPLKHERTHEVVVVNVNNNNYGGGGGYGPPGGTPPLRRVVQTQPKPAQVKQKEAAPPEATPPGSHRLICESCGKCKCVECVAPRPLPSRMACGGQCVCSADSVLEHATCLCLVKGLFYHCSSEGGDDAGDSCADRPCSLTRPRCPARFLCMALMAPVFPCLLCYPPLGGAVRACRYCHDCLRRPGCRCQNSNAVYRWGGEQGHAPGKPT